MQAESVSRPGSRPDVYGESQPFGEFLRTVLRYLPIILVVAGLAGAAAYTMTTPQPPQPVASAQIGLTQQIVWPFYDAARQRAVTTVEDPTFVTELTGRVAQGPLSVEVDAPDAQAFVIIEVTADTPEVAATAANVAAELLLERDQVRLSESADQDLVAAEALLEASKARVAERATRLAELIPAEAEAGAEVGLRPTSTAAREELLAAQLERTSLSQLQNEELRRQVEIQISFDEAQAAIGSVVPEMEILRRAEDPGLGEQRSLIPVIAAVAVTMIAGLGMAILWDRTRGPLASRWHAEQVAGVQVLADMAPKRSRERSAGLFLAGLVNGAEASGNTVALTGLKGTATEQWLAMIVQYFQLSGMKVLVLVDSAGEKQIYGDGSSLEWKEIELAKDWVASLDGVSTIVLPSTAMLLDAAAMRPLVRDIATQYDLVLVAGGVMEERTSDLAIALADVTVLIARKRQNRVDQLRRAARTITSRHEKLLGVVLGGNRLPAFSSRVEPYPEEEAWDAGSDDATERRPALWT